jgi:hypothetical protein
MSSFPGGGNDFVPSSSPLQVPMDFDLGLAPDVNDVISAIPGVIPVQPPCWRMVTALQESPFGTPT